MVKSKIMGLLQPVSLVITIQSIIYIVFLSMSPGVGMFVLTAVEVGLFVA